MRGASRSPNCTCCPCPNDGKCKQKRGPSLRDSVNFVVSSPEHGTVRRLPPEAYHPSGSAEGWAPITGSFTLPSRTYCRISIREAVNTFWSYLPRTITRCPSFSSSTLAGLFRIVNFVWSV